MLLEEDKEYNGNSPPEQLEREVQKLGESMDGRKLLERVIQWLGEYMDCRDGKRQQESIWAVKHIAYFCYIEEL